jgi:CubicO group peptidase (beta-lactamase class C family)
MFSLPDPVIDFVREQMEASHIPGAAVALIRGQGEIRGAGFGLQSLEGEEPVHPQSVFEIASISKQFTAAAILLLQERSYLALDDPVEVFIPGSPPSWRGVTIRHLLSASSGIKDYLNDLEGPDVPVRGTSQELIEFVSRLPLNFPPGQRYSYSNTGYVILSMVVEQVTGLPYHEFLTSQMLIPLGLHHTFPNNLSRLVPDRVSGYEFQSPSWRDRHVVYSGKASGGDGELLSTLSDLCAWATSWSNGQVLNPSSIQLALTPATDRNGQLLQTTLSSNYGLGWFLGDHRGHPVQWTPGAGEGFSTTLMRFPHDQIVVIVLLNLEQFLLADELARRIAELCWESI